ncbi:MAG: hypothetical protein R2780_03525 [Crocinitomicaceae bacterium]|nr:hypothetical protein [Crocinitomicaceae bacterium]
MRIFLIIGFLLTALISIGQNEQDSILLLNGKVYYGEVTGIEKIEGDSVLNFNTLNKKNEKVTDQLSLYRVFSYTKNGQENIMYSQNEFLGNYLSVNETKEVTIGSYDARQTFKPTVPFWTTYTLGLGVSVMDTYLSQKVLDKANYTNPYGYTTPGLFKDRLSLLPVLVPIVASVSWSLPSFKLKEKKMIHKSYFNNVNYYRGYHRIAKQKRMLGSMLGGFAGIATGWTTHLIINAFN